MRIFSCFFFTAICSFNVVLRTRELENISRRGELVNNAKVYLKLAMFIWNCLWLVFYSFFLLCLVYLSVGLSPLTSLLSPLLVNISWELVVVALAQMEEEPQGGDTFDLNTVDCDGHVPFSIVIDAVTLRAGGYRLNPELRSLICIIELGHVLEYARRTGVDVKDIISNRAFINRQEPEDVGIGEHYDQGAMISTSTHVFGELTGAGLVVVLNGEPRRIVWGISGIGLQFTGAQLIHSSIPVERGIDYAVVLFLEIVTDSGSIGRSVMFPFLGERFQVLTAEQASRMVVLLGEIPEEVWKHERETNGPRGSPRRRGSTRATGSDDECHMCGEGGDLLCCEGCPCVYHLGCVVPSIVVIPDGSWFCEACSVCS